MYWIHHSPSAILLSLTNIQHTISDTISYNPTEAQSAERIFAKFKYFMKTNFNILININVLRTSLSICDTTISYKHTIHYLRYYFL